jgi:hypothetical protein
VSLDIARKTDAAQPDDLRTNVVSTVFRYLVRLKANLEAVGNQVFFVGKTAGEGQFTPPGFEPRNVRGHDGKFYTITGVSHDALWVNGRQFDTAARANDSAEPLFHSDGTPMTAQPAWNAIPEEYWRPNNPPISLDDVVVPPTKPEPPPPPVKKPYPGDPEFDAVGVALFADYARAGNAPDPQMGRWFGRTIFDWLNDNEPTLDASIKKHRAEWRAILGIPQE